MKRSRHARKSEEDAQSSPLHALKMQVWRVWRDLGCRNRVRPALPASSAAARNMVSVEGLEGDRFFARILFVRATFGCYDSRAYTAPHGRVGNNTNGSNGPDRSEIVSGRRLMSWDAVILKIRGPVRPIEEVGDDDYLPLGDIEFVSRRFAQRFRMRNGQTRPTHSADWTMIRH